MRKYILFSIIVVSALWFFSSATAQAATRYVRTDGHDTSCNGTADASVAYAPNCAFRTITKGIATAIGGDTVEVGNGDYRNEGKFTINRNANPGITVKSQNRRQALVSSFELLSSASYWTIQGFKLPSDFSSYNCFYINGGSYNKFVDNELIRCYVGFYIPNGENNEIRNNLLTIPDFGFDMHGNYNKVINNEISGLLHYDWYGNGMGDVDYMRIWGGYHLIKGNNFHGPHGSLADAHVDCWQTFGTGGDEPHHIIFDGNKCSDAHEIMMNDYQVCDPATLRCYGHDNTWRNNIIWNLQTAFGGKFVYNNIFAFMTYEVGSGLGTAKNNIFYEANIMRHAKPFSALVAEDHNLIWDSVKTFTSADYSGTGDLFVNPQFVNVPKAAVYLKRNGATYLGDNTHIEVTSGGVSFFVIGEYFEYCRVPYGCDGIAHKITGKSGNVIAFTPAINPYVVPSFSAYSESTDNARIWGDNTNFVLDWRLKSTSPAINYGTAISDWSNPSDISGFARPQGSGWDIGAYEYTGSVPQTCTYTYSEWSVCQSNNTQSRIVISSSPSGCTGTPVLTQSCTYTPPAQTRTYSTNFPLTENPISESGNWINGGTVGLVWNNVKTLSGRAIGVQMPVEYADPTAILTGTWGPDQTAEATVYSVNPTNLEYQEVELRFRSAISANSNTGYEVFFRVLKTAEGYAEIVRWDGPLGDWHSLARNVGVQYGVQNGDVIKATIVGNVIKGYINGVMVVSAVDNTFTTGNPGIGFYNDPGNSFTDFGLTSFTVTATLNDTQAPTVPSNLSATAISSSQINLSWTASTDNVGVTGYRIYRSGAQIGTSVSNSYSDIGLSANTTYSYTVSAYDAAGDVSAQSASASATTQMPSANIEAESGTLVSPMQIVSDSSASGGSYIRTNTVDQGTASYSFNIANDSVYKIIARVYVPDGASDSFYVKIDNQAEDVWDLNPTGAANEFSVWREDEVTKRGTGTPALPQYDPYTVNLTAGNHTLTFRGREAYARLDYFRLVKITDTTPPGAPTGLAVR